MKETGELLKKTRESRELSLHEVGMSLKINPKTLQAIEEGDMEALPQRAFLRGFVKSYGKFLKLDMGSTMTLFDQELKTRERMTIAAVNKGGAASETADVVPRPLDSDSKLSEKAPHYVDRSWQTQKRNIFITVMVVILGFFVMVTAKLVSKYQKERVISKRGSSLTQPSEVRTSPHGMGQEVAVVPRPVESTTAATVPNPLRSGDEGKEKATKEEESAKPAHLVEGNTQNVVTQTPSLLGVTTSANVNGKTKEISESPLVAVANEGQAAAMTRAQEVILEASKPVKISYQLDGTSLKALDLNSGDIHTFKGKKRIFLEISNGRAVRIIANGRDLGSASNIEAPVKMSFPK